MKRLYFLLTILIGYSLPGLAQYHFDGFSKLYSAGGADLISCITYDSTHNVLFFGMSSLQSDSGPWYQMAIYYKTDVQGHVLKRTVDTMHGFETGSNCVIQSKDKKKLYWGGWRGYINRNKDSSGFLILTKTDKNLNIIWQKSISIPAQHGAVSSLAELPEKNRIFMLATEYSDRHSNFPIRRNKLYLIIFDTSGHLLSQTIAGPDAPADGQSIVATRDGNLLISGNSYAWGGYKAMSIKVDTAGHEIWHTLYGRDAYSTMIMNTLFLNNGTHYFNAGNIVPVHEQLPYTLAGHSYGYVNKINSSGTLLWEKKWRYTKIMNNFWDITKGIGNDLLVACGATSLADTNVDRGWIVGIDGEGNIKWSREVSQHTGLNEEEYLYNVVALKDGSFVAAGSAMKKKENNTNWFNDGQDGWLIRFDSNGCIHPEHCKDLGMSDNFLVRNNLNIYPNPTSGVLNLSRKKPFPKESQVRLLDNQGRVLRTLPDPAGRMKMSYHLKGLPAGVYYLEVTVKGYVQTQKVVLER